MRNELVHCIEIIQMQGEGQVLEPRHETEI